MRKLNRIDLASLPLELAIKKVKGKGERRLIVFSDADCPFCARLEDEMKDVDNVTIYTFLFPIDQLHPDAARKSRMIWCAADRVKAWDDFFESGKLPDNKGECYNPVAATQALGAEAAHPGDADADPRRRIGDARRGAARAPRGRDEAKPRPTRRSRPPRQEVAATPRDHDTRTTGAADGDHRFPEETVHRHHRVDRRLARHAVVAVPRRGQGDQERRATDRARDRSSRSSSTSASSATRSVRASTR